VADYWSVYEDKQWAISVYDNRYHNRTYDTIDLKNSIMVNSARQSQQIVRPGRAYFLKIGTDFDSSST
jgi:thiamine biosynthesis lipoprotein ApbE